MPLTKEQLLLDRVKVISDYPDSIYKIGDIIVYSREVAQSYDEWHNTRSGERFFKNPGFFKKYPNIFQPLPWWSDRKDNELPEYVKHKHGWIDKHIGVNHFGDCFTFIGRNDIIDWKFEYFQPATEQEYIEYINQKQQ